MGESGLPHLETQWRRSVIPSTCLPDSEKKVVHSEDAVLLSRQLRTAGKSEVRSLIKTTGTSSVIGPDVVTPGLREVIVSGTGAASYASLKSVAFGSFNERANPVKLNGKAYRGQLEVFVNSPRNVDGRECRAA